ncbi:MAG: MFS transporter [Desulfurococcaceae archaeon]
MVGKINAQRVDQSSWIRWVILFILTSNFLLVLGYAFALTAPIVPALIRELNITLTMAGLLSTSLNLAGAILSLPSGVLLDSIGAEKGLIISLLAGCIGWVICAISPDFNTLLIGRFFIGICGIILGAGGPIVIIKWFKEKEQGIALGIWSASMATARAVFTPMASLITTQYGWRAVFTVGLISSIILLPPSVLMLMKSSRIENIDVRHNKVSLKGLKDSLRSFQIWLFGLTIFIGLSPANIFGTYGVTLLSKEKGFSESIASLLLGIMGVCGIFGSMFGGWLSVKIGKKRTYLVSLCGEVIPFITFALVYQQYIVMAMVLIIGLVSAIKSPMNYSIPPSLAVNGYVGMALGIARIFMYLPGAIMPPISGFIYESYGFIELMLVQITLLLLACLLVMRLKVK